MSENFEEYIFSIVEDLTKNENSENKYTVFNGKEENDVQISYTKNNQKHQQKFKRKITGLISLPSYKFVDFVEWDKTKEKVIVIGYNPSLSLHDNLDRTNKNIFRFLDKNGYGGYYLLNIYPIVSPDPEDVDDSDYNLKFINKINQILKKNNDDYRLKVFIVWGKMCCPNDVELLNQLETAKDNELLFATTYQNELKHMSLRGMVAENINESAVKKIEIKGDCIIIIPKM